MMWNYFITCLVLLANIVSIHTFLMGNNLNLGPTGGNFKGFCYFMTPDPLDQSLRLATGKGFGPSMGQMEVPAFIRMSPSVETICATQSPLLNPMDRNGLLSDLVGQEISRRSLYLAANPSLAGTGKWECAANYYTNVMRYRPNELGNVFGDLIDSTGCDGFTCDMVRGVRKQSPMSNFLNAMLLNQMMQSPSSATAPSNQQPPTSNTGAVQQPPSTSNPPANPQPKPSPPQPQPTPTATQGPSSTTNTGLDLTNIFSNPQFQEQLRILISNVLTQNNQMGPSMPGQGVFGF